MTLWSHSLRTGDTELDAHHRELLALLDGACAAAEHHDRAGVEASLARVQSSCLAHFEVEQRAMASLGGLALDGPAVQAHLDSHAEFLTDLERLRGELGHRGLTPLVQLWLSSRLVEWLRFHTRTMDAALVAATSRAVTGAPQGATVIRLSPNAP